jgi:hypothetical protein
MSQKNTASKHFPEKKIWVFIDFFHAIKLPKALRYELKMLNVHFEQRSGLCKENFCAHESLGY